MATCDRCHRPVATTLNEAQQMAAGYCAVELLAGQPWGDVAADRCAAARDAWHVAEIARLTARVAELEAQVAANRWGRCACGCGVWTLTEPGGLLWRGVVEGTEDGYRYCGGGVGCVEWRGVCATEAEAKAAAEKACGVGAK